ncbi:MAG: hypothetical protein SVM79_05690, partial [Chloroflexota bacterium]|nr:hypothetical protein [Chloroflexota bacterium]
TARSSVRNSLTQYSVRDESVGTLALTAFRNTVLCPPRDNTLDGIQDFSLTISPHKPSDCAVPKRLHLMSSRKLTFVVLT